MHYCGSDVQLQTYKVRKRVFGGGRQRQGNTHQIQAGPAQSANCTLKGTFMSAMFYVAGRPSHIPFSFILWTWVSWDDKYIQYTSYLLGNRPAFTAVSYIDCNLFVHKKQFPTFLVFDMYQPSNCGRPKVA